MGTPETVKADIPVVEVDFNSEADDGSIPADLACAAGELVVGGSAVMIDSEGNACKGEVRRIDDDGIAYLVPAWPSWVAGISRDPSAHTAMHGLSVSSGAVRAR
jgi:hypothetical protein